MLQCCTQCCSTKVLHNLECCPKCCPKCCTKCCIKCCTVLYYKECCTKCRTVCCIIKSVAQSVAQCTTRSVAPRQPGQLLGTHSNLFIETRKVSSKCFSFPFLQRNNLLRVQRRREFFFSIILLQILYFAMVFLFPAVENAELPEKLSRV